MSYKPFLTYDAQLEKLKNKNIIISDKCVAKSILQDVSYYTLINGYKNSYLMDSDTECFIEPISIERLFKIHILDSNICNILLKYILFVERSLKTKLSYVVAESFSEFEDIYLRKELYSNSSGNRHKVLKGLNKALNGNDSIMTHYKTKFHIPPWILVTALSFNKAIGWYSILPSDKKTIIVNNFFKNTILNIEEKKQLFKKCLDILLEFRNNTAHGKRTFASNSKIELPKVPLYKIINEEILTYEEYREYKTGIYATIISLFLLLDQDQYLEQLSLDIYLFIKNTAESEKDIESIVNFPSEIIDRMFKFRILKYDYWKNMCRIISLYKQ